MKNDIFMTVAIPVYNGEKFLEETILSVIEQSPLNNSVEVIACDNCSTDSTPNIIKKYSIVKHIRHNTNIGYDRNVDSLFKNASGKYVWILAADDMLKDDAIDLVIKVLTTFDNIGVCYTGGYKKHNPILEEFYIAENGDDFFDMTHRQFGGVSSNVILKSAWEETSLAKYFDSAWIHVAVVMEIASKYRTVVFRDMLMFDNPKSVNEPKTWAVNGKQLLFGIKLVKIFSQMKDFNYKSITIQESYKIITSGYPREIIYAKAKGLVVDKRLLLDFFNLYKYKPSLWLVWFPTLLTPKSLCILIIRIFRILKNYVK